MLPSTDVVSCGNTSTTGLLDAGGIERTILLIVSDSFVAVLH